MIEHLIDWLIDWLTEWLIDWLNDWLTDWLIEWLLLTELKKCICISTMRILRNCFTRNKHLSLYPKRRPPQPPSLPRLSNYNLFFYKSQIVPESCCSCWDVVWKCKNHETKKAEKEGSKVIAFWLTSTAFNSLIWLRHKTATVLITLHVKKKIIIIHQISLQLVFVTILSQLVKWESFLANCNWKIILLLWSFHWLKYIQDIAVHFCYLSVSMCTMIGQFSVPSFHNTVCLNWNLPPLIEPRVKTNISITSFSWSVP